MSKNPVTYLLIIIFIYPLIKGFLLKFSSNKIEKEATSIESNVSFIISVIMGFYYGKKIFFQQDKDIYIKLFKYIPETIRLYIEKQPLLVYLLIIPFIIFILYLIVFFIIRQINKLTLLPFLSKIEKYLDNKNNFTKRIYGMLFQIPKSIIYILIVSILLNIISILNYSSNINLYLEQSIPYKYICEQAIIPITNSKIAKNLPNIIDNSFKVEVKKQTNNENTLVYYNGITLEEGVRSNEEIDDISEIITKNEINDENRAKRIYQWIGTNIEYDNEKANKILANDFSASSGAIPCFNQKAGICFDYSCLFVSMCRANDIKVRLITGQGFNGVSWVGHAWNEVYLENQNKWINVDTTFYSGGNYFDSNRFLLDHKDGEIAGEW
ncbi:MAG: transglutaminase-like domain-containing protein [Clostridiaceae bacterium]